jgi:hypothetical protein
MGNHEQADENVDVGEVEVEDYSVTSISNTLCRRSEPDLSSSQLDPEVVIALPCFSKLC